MVIFKIRCKNNASECRIAAEGERKCKIITPDAHLNPLESSDAQELHYNSQTSNSLF